MISMTSLPCAHMPSSVLGLAVESLQSTKTNKETSSSCLNLDAENPESEWQIYGKTVFSLFQSPLFQNEKQHPFSWELVVRCNTFYG